MHAPPAVLIVCSNNIYFCPPPHQFRCVTYFSDIANPLRNIWSFVFHQKIVKFVLSACHFLLADVECVKSSFT